MSTLKLRTESSNLFKTKSVDKWSMKCGKYLPKTVFIAFPSTTTRVRALFDLFTFKGAPSRGSVRGTRRERRDLANAILRSADKRDKRHSPSRPLCRSGFTSLSSTCRIIGYRTPVPRLRRTVTHGGQRVVYLR
uniref:Uncharacterized protein n=1 Tax=Steinernema glaseri TaxID=37863 RepID=A0A1I7Z2S9_9BILA